MKLIFAQINQNEIEDALKSKDIFIGAEFEFIFTDDNTQILRHQEEYRAKILEPLQKVIRAPIDIEPWLELQGRTIQKGWVLEYDTSLPSYTGAELVSPPMPLSEFLKICPQIFQAIDELGYTTNKCGFHVNISIKDTSKINPLKLALFIDEDLVYSTFSREARKKWGNPIKDWLKQNLGMEFIQLDLRSLEKALTIQLERKLKHLLTKEYGLNTGKLEQDYVEFRYMGGKNYHKKWNKIKNIIGMYIFVLKIAKDKNYKRKEYKDKVIKLFTEELNLHKFLIAQAKTWIKRIKAFLKYFNLTLEDKIQVHRKGAVIFEVYGHPKDMEKAMTSLPSGILSLPKDIAKISTTAYYAGITIPMASKKIIEFFDKKLYKKTT